MEIKLTTGTRAPEIFKEYQLKTIEALALTGKTPIENKAIWDYVTEAGIKISRASCINFVQNLHDLDLVKGVETTGKGGNRYAYTLVSDRELFDAQVVSIFMDALLSLYPETEFQGILDMCEMRT